MGMTIDDNIDVLNIAKKFFEDVTNNPKIKEPTKAHLVIESLETAISIMREYQKIFDKYEILTASFEDSDSPEVWSKKIDEFCIDTMRGLLGDYYVDRIKEDSLRSVSEDGNNI